MAVSKLVKTIESRRTHKYYLSQSGGFLSRSYQSCASRLSQFLSTHFDVLQSLLLRGEVRDTPGVQQGCTMLTRKSGWDAIGNTFLEKKEISPHD